MEISIEGKVQRVVRSLHVSIIGAKSVWKCPELGVLEIRCPVFCLPMIL